MSGIVTISVEIELGWGYHDIGNYRKLSADRQEETDTLARFLTLCDDLEIPITFDVVGHLLLEECDGTHPSPHPDGWFSADPGTDASTHPLFYAPDLVETILDADVDHEIGSHTFSHVLFDGLPPAVIDWELEQVERVHQAFGLSAPVSLVPPRNQSPPLAQVNSHGVDVVRQRYNESPTSPLYEYLWNLIRTSPVMMPRRTNGVVETYVVDAASLTAGHLPVGQKPAHPAYRPLPVAVRKQLQYRTFKKSLHACIRQDSAVHFWTHLHDMTHPAQWSLVEQSLRTLADYHRNNEIEIVPMVGLIDHA